MADLTKESEVEQTYHINVKLHDQIIQTVENGDQAGLIVLLSPMHAADIADMLEQIEPQARQALLTLWGDEINGAILAEIDEELSADIVCSLSDSVMGTAVRDLETNDIIALVEDLDEVKKQRVLGVLTTRDRMAVLQSLQCPEDSAGRLMQRDLVMAPDHWTVSDAIDRLRIDQNLPDRFYDIFIVSPKLEPVGNVALYSLIANARTITLKEIMDQDFHKIPVMQSQEDVAYVFNQYNMVSAAVVDLQGRLLGVITIDDAMAALEQEAEQDIKFLAGVGAESLTDGLRATTALRFPWLAINLLTAILALLVIAHFSMTIEMIIALAVLMPIVASMGGNAATQTLTVVVRALATKDLTSSNVMRIIRREVFVGLLNGFIFAVIVGLICLFWYESALLSFVLALAMIINLLVAGFAGIIVPIGCDKLGIDPALSSSPFVTTITDIVGFFAFLALASIILL